MTIWLESLRVLDGIVLEGGSNGLNTEAVVFGVLLMDAMVREGGLEENTSVWMSLELKCGPIA